MSHMHKSSPFLSEDALKAAAAGATVNIRFQSPGAKEEEEMASSTVSWTAVSLMYSLIGSSSSVASSESIKGGGWEGDSVHLWICMRLRLWTCNGSMQILWQVPNQQVICDNKSLANCSTGLFFKYITGRYLNLTKARPLWRKADAGSNSGQRDKWK